MFILSLTCIGYDTEQVYTVTAIGIRSLCPYLVYGMIQSRPILSLPCVWYDMFRAGLYCYSDRDTFTLSLPCVWYDTEQAYTVTASDRESGG